jgi:hypothetical protein
VKTYYVSNKPSNKTLLSSALAALLLVMSSSSFAEGGSVYHSGQASKHSALAISEGAKTSARVVNGVVAVPLIVMGGMSTATGNGVTALGESIARGPMSMHSSAHPHTPLAVTELVITADPAPNKVIITSKTKKVTQETIIETQ